MQKSKRKLALILIWAIAVPVFALSQISFWRIGEVSAATATATTTPEQQAAQDKIEETKNAAEKLQAKIDKENKAKALLEKNLGQIQSAVFSTQKSINTTKSVIVETDTDIVRKEKEIENLSSQLVVKQEMLKNLIQQAYYVQNKPILNVILLNESLAGMFGDMQNLNSLDEKISLLIEEINAKKAQISGDKSELAKKKEEHLEILEEKTDQKKDLVVAQVEVQGDIQEKEATIEELQQKLAELQGDLNTLTGKSFNASDINEAISYASKKTGVPKGVLYGFLKRETNLGANTGQCTYADVKKVSITGYKKYGKKYQKSIDLLYKRENLFNGIIEDLGYSKNKKVSCTISFANAGPNQGGAMGVSQFMSDTWLGWESQISSATGSSKPDPWDLADGVMAMALKVKSAGGTSTSASAIRKAQINYYGAFSQGYYDVVYYWAKNYDKLFK